MDVREIRFMDQRAASGAFEWHYIGGMMPPVLLRVLKNMDGC
jgi:hypothetical protein